MTRALDIVAALIVALLLFLMVDGLIACLAAIWTGEMG